MKGTGVPREPHREDGVSRMQFLLDLRQRGINDVVVLRALDDVPREHFVDDRFADDAYADRALPIACGQTISPTSCSRASIAAATRART